MNAKNPLDETPDIEEILAQHYGAPTPSADFAARLRAQLRARAQSGAARRAAFFFTGFARAALGVTLFAALVGLVVLGLRLRPQPQPAAAQQTPSAAAPTPLPTVTAPTPTPPAVPAPLAVSPRLCALTAPTPTLDAAGAQEHGGPFLYNRPAQPLNRDGAVTSGDFRFELLLYCDTTFVLPNAAAEYSHASEIDGLGLYAAYDYQGSATMEGEISEISGFVPYIRYSGGGGPITGPGSGGRIITGIDFPDDVLVDFSQDAIPLRFIYKVQDPQGNFAGASLNFTLRRETDGYTVTDIAVEALTGEELTGETYTAAPLPTRDTALLDPSLAELKTLLDRAHGALLDAPGWLHVVSHITNQERQGTLPNGAAIPNEYTMDAWYLLGEGRKLTAAVTITRYADERLNQVAVYQDGVWRNFTVATTFRAPGERLSGLDGDWYSAAVRAVRAGDALTREAVDGGVQFTIQREQYRQVALLDAESGLVQWTEFWQLMPEGWERIYRMENLTQERAAQPPADVLAQFDQPMKGYQPLPPQGTPAPAGFDPAVSTLKLIPIAGDDFDMPTFWYGDLYADNYLLGRMEFGDVPGGHCQRSADGAKIAFQYQPHGGNASLHWLDLRDVNSIQDPLPNLRLLSVPTWSPVANVLSFAGCTSETACQTYLLDVETGKSRRLSETYSPWPAVWKPDGSRLALITLLENNQQALVEMDASTGQVLYSGPADYPNIPADSPVAEWDVAFPAGSSGFGACEQPVP